MSKVLEKSSIRSILAFGGDCLVHGEFFLLSGCDYS